MRFLRLLILSCLIAAASQAASAQSSEAWAVLVGVSEYPELTALRPLRGPALDVTSMRDSLQRARAGWREVRVLADGVPRAAGPPTRAAILEALERVAKNARAERHRRVLFQRLRLAAGGEEILLPKDAGKWSESAGRVPNAISRSELNALFAPLVAAARGSG